MKSKPAFDGFLTGKAQNFSTAQRNVAAIEVKPLQIYGWNNVIILEEYVLGSAAWETWKIVGSKLLRSQTVRINLLKMTTWESAGGCRSILIH